MAESNRSEEDVNELISLLREWEEQQTAIPNYDPVPTLTRLCELIENEMECYLKMDPDPFDDRHPSRSHPDSYLGQMFKVLFKKDAFMTKLVGDYMRENWNHSPDLDIRQLNMVAARLFLDVMPGLESSVVFQESDGLILRLYNWAEKESEPLRSYATGLLAAAMEVQDIAANFRDQNGHLVPIILQRLKVLQDSSQTDASSVTSRPFRHLGRLEEERDERKKAEKRRHSVDEERQDYKRANGLMVNKVNDDAFVPSPPSHPALSPPYTSSNKPSTYLSRHYPAPFINEGSNSSWQEMESNVIGPFKLYPPTLATQQILLLRYLTPMGEYQELLSHVFEHNALDLILRYVDLTLTRDSGSRLAFEALKYLAALLCHKKFALEFISCGGLQKLLSVPRPSIAATGVSLCLYYLAYCEDAMQRVCVLPRIVTFELVKYALWLLECSHDSGRCHATMFFGLAYQFKVILELFDAQDGLRKLFNVISTLPILSPEEPANSNHDDEEFVARQAVRHVCGALKRYFEAQLSQKTDQLQRVQSRDAGGSSVPSIPSYKARKCSQDEVQENVRTMLEMMPFNARWAPVDEFVRLGGIGTLLQVVGLTTDWNYSGRSETVKSALDVIAICCTMASVQLLLCEEKVTLPSPDTTVSTSQCVGMGVIVAATEGEIMADVDVQRAALFVIITCVCGPIHRVNGRSSVCLMYPSETSFQGEVSKQRVSVRTSEELINKLWECVRINNGLMALMQLMILKTPITDADSVRSLACRALNGLSRSVTVCQIVGKLPLFTSGHMYVLMREPILREKRLEHVNFQRYGLELLESVLGKTKTSGNEYEISLATLHRANVVAQTRIQYNERQLLQLIQQHLHSKGLHQSAVALQKEAGLNPVAIRHPLTTPTVILAKRTGRLNSMTLPRPPSAIPSSSRSSTPLRAAPLSARLSPMVNRTPNRSTAFTLRSVCAGDSITINTPHAFIPPLRIIYNKKSTPLAPRIISHSSPNIVMSKPTTFTPHESSPPGSSVSLESIVSEYLINQHTLCKKPMVTCPQFDLFQPHKCPDLQSRSSASLNVTSRLHNRSIRPPHGGPRGAKLDRQLLYSRFRPVRTFRHNSEDGFITCCSFSVCEQWMMAGTYQGEVKLFNLQTATEEATYQCHNSYIHHLQPSSTGDLLITSSLWRKPYSALWKMASTFDVVFNMENEEYAEFSKQTVDRIIGTISETGNIYDVRTTKKIQVLKSAMSNHYIKNRATFHPTDDLVLCDGVLWDIRMSKQVHKLDKLNQTLSGVFHPNGLEIIADSEVWDLRNFHLLHTVAQLSQSLVQFSSDGRVIFALTMEQESTDAAEVSYLSSFKTLDSSDYSSIATVDTRRSLYSLGINGVDSQIALVENCGPELNVEETCIKLYDVGRLRDDEDEVEEEEEEIDDGSDDGEEEELDDQALNQLLGDEADEGDDGDEDYVGDAIEEQSDADIESNHSDDIQTPPTTDNDEEQATEEDDATQSDETTSDDNDENIRFSFREPGWEPDN